MGCLGDILSALKIPLCYLNLSNCCLLESDILELMNSQHCLSLKELSLEHVTTPCENNNNELHMNMWTAFLKNLENIPCITILNMGNADITADVIVSHNKCFQKLTRLKLLRLDGISLKENDIFDILKALKSSQIQRIYFTLLSKCESLSKQDALAFWSKINHILDWKPVKVVVEGLFDMDICNQ